ncbi:MAG: 16S rRNA (cytosine(1402)-N(4))-methyltransferase, partial [Thermoplasmatales archaeon]|nr:16S rRNA (cytosine(1402)-N(4))-methyltransferase [Thermoplasmatales archaeon]
MHGDTFFHQPVMVAEVIQHMNLQQDKGFYCDCTVGG